MFKVKLLPPVSSYETGRAIMQAEVIEGNYREWYADQNTDKDYELSCKMYRRRRSNEANAYFHVLCGKIAEKLGTSKIEVKNRMIALYGQPYVINGKLQYVILSDEIDVYKSEYVHLQPTPQTKELNGVLYRVHINMRHTGKSQSDEGYNTQEFAVLIDGTISEAREIGMSEAEIMTRKDAEMLELYGIKV